jgi:hypothetical protein
MAADTIEPDFGPFRPVTLEQLDEIVSAHVTASPSLILVDGRSGAGKSTFAAGLARARGAALVSTDDVSWHLHPTDWAEQMLEGVVRPWAEGLAVKYTPPGWVRRGRVGHIEVPASADLVIEGVGAARHELAPFAQLIAWIRSNRTEARRRGIERDIDEGRTREEAEQFWDDWMSAEEPFLEAEQPWDRAHLVVDGTAEPKDAAAHVRVISTGARPTA